ncbi:MAG: putative peptidoglycan glycosyltransferase FtsW [Gemmatimonadales bacterium]
MSGKGGQSRWEVRLLAVIAATLTVFGIASVYSAASFQSKAWVEVLKQLSGAAIGGMVLLIASRVDYRRWRPLAWPLLGGTLLLLLLVIAPGVPDSIVPVRNGARRWIQLPLLSFQPSEIARFVIVVWVSAIAFKKGAQIREFKKGILPVLLVTALVAGLVMVEPNLSLATVLALLGGVVLFVAGARIGQFLLLGVTGLFLLMGAVQAFPHSFRRVNCFLGLADCQGADWQVGQAVLGLASGRWIGLGFGEGQLKLNYLPYAPSDFLFSTIGEEWGFLGVTFVIGLFALFCWVGFRIARQARDPFGQLLAAGLTASIGLSALMHMAVNLSLMPTTGQTLPFMSAGRSSLIVTLLAVGVVISVGRGPAPARSRGRAGRADE